MKQHRKQDDKYFNKLNETEKDMKELQGEIAKGRQSNIKRAYEQGKKDMLEEVIKIIDNWYARRLSINDVLEGKTVQKLRESLGEIK